jgi:hypothetical protein
MVSRSKSTVSMKWSAQTVARIIQNPIYKGEYVWRHTAASTA